MLIFAHFIGGCQSKPNVPPSSKAFERQSAETITLYNWPDDIPQDVLDQFTAESGIQVNDVNYESQDAALENMIRSTEYDVVVLDNQNIARAAALNLLEPINFGKLNNWKYIAPNFRNLAHDPGNLYSVPYTWGFIGIAVRPDLITTSITSWNDFWDPAHAMRVGAWGDEPRLMMSIALKASGFSANSEDPAELEQALTRLLSLKPALQLMEQTAEMSAGEQLAHGRVWLMVAWSEDVREAHQAGSSAEYILPEEGAIVWGDNFVIPTNSKNQANAQKFINFLLRPEISAQIVQYNGYATANSGAINLLGDVYQTDMLLMPPTNPARHDEVLLPLSAAGNKLYHDLWQRFLAAD